MPLFGGIKKEHLNELIGVFLAILSIWILISLIGYGGGVGNRLQDFLTHFIGYISYLFAALILYWGVSLFFTAKRGILSGLFGSLCLLLSGLMLMGSFTSQSRAIIGDLGGHLDSFCTKWIGSPGLFLAAIVFLIAGVILASELTFKSLFGSIFRVFSKPSPPPKKRRKKLVPDEEGSVIEIDEQPIAVPQPSIIVSDESATLSDQDIHLRPPDTTRPYILPPLSIIDRIEPPDMGTSDEILKEKANILEKSFNDFNIDAKVVRVKRGPVITRYEVEPGTGVKVSKFLSLSDDLTLALRATRVRVVAPVPGKGVIGIEVPNEQIASVGLREVLESQEFRNTKLRIPIPLGKDISGTPFVVDLASMPHLLIAGTTGSGKSVFINSAITSMLFRMTPDELRLLMIDPKRVELNIYDGIPHLMAPVVTDSMRAPAYLKWALREVDKRYKKLADLGVRNIEGYNQYLEKHPDVVGKVMPEDQLVHGRLPYIVIIIDELADLMMVASSEVEESITRLAQIARAAGVHMLVSTQRPSVNVVTGSIKANLPCRLSFRLASKVDSRTILDMNGAENLLGRGDMLFLDTNAAKPVRIQGCYISEVEIEKIVSFVEQHAPHGVMDHGVTESDALDVEESMEDDRDELYEEAVRVVLRQRTATTSFLQRKLNISYDRAVQILEDMEAEGIVGPNIGHQPREILIDHYSD
jgi:S-DNA-T family DNA segregation ATPase FtsK/SpoIIIE